MSKDGEIRLATFNLQGGGAGPNNSYEQYDLATEFFTDPENHADLMLIQEGKTWLDDDARRLHRFARAVNLSVAEYAHPEHTRCTLITLYNQDVLHQQSERSITGPAPYWHGRVSVDFSEKNERYPDAASFKVVNRHGNPFDAAHRLAEVKYDVGYTKVPAKRPKGGALPSGAVILGGDWNSLAVAAPELDWPRENEVRPEDQERYVLQREYQCLVDPVTNQFVLDEEGRPQNDRRPREVLERVGLVDVGTLFDHHPPTAGFDGKIPGERAIDGFHASQIAVAKLIDTTNPDNFGPMQTLEQALRIGDHRALFLQLGLAALREPETA